jgi:hypothetical protein
MVELTEVSARLKASLEHLNVLSGHQVTSKLRESVSFMPHSQNTHDLAVGAFATIIKVIRK